jgi:AcrR family transcriptional regulator/DNA-binding MarR family transcriptional regulator
VFVPEGDTTVVAAQDGRGQVSAVQRMRMLVAARQVVAQEGYARMSVERVVARAGVSRKTFYDLFENREECFLEAFDDAIDRAAQAVTGAYKGERTWRERIRAGLAAVLGVLDEEPELCRVCVVEALAAGPLVLEHRARVLGVLIDAVDEGRRETRGDPPPLTAEGVVGAVFAVIHARAAARVNANATSVRGRAANAPLSSLVSALMGMIVLPYLGARVAAREAARPVPKRTPSQRCGSGGALEALDMRLTYRTLRVLAVIAQHPGASNRAVAQGADVADQGQVSKLLSRLASLGLIENGTPSHLKGTPNAWRLTPRGEEMERAIRTEVTPG